MLAVKRHPNMDLGVYLPIGTRLDVRWVRIDDPLASAESCYAQGAAKGGARFSRLEGAWWGDRTGYFLSTNGGSVGEGQVFEYDPDDETVKVIYDAPNANAVDNPDNITVTPRGGLLLCEDAAGNNFTEGERLVGLTLHGKAFTFAMNNIVLATSYNAAVPAGRLPSERVGGCLLQPRRQLALREHPDAGRDLRDHRAVGARAACRERGQRADGLIEEPRCQGRRETGFARTALSLLP